MWRYFLEIHLLYFHLLFIGHLRVIIENINRIFLLMAELFRLLLLLTCNRFHFYYYYRVIVFLISAAVCLRCTVKIYFFTWNIQSSIKLAWINTWWNGSFSTKRIKSNVAAKFVFLAGRNVRAFFLHWFKTLMAEVDFCNYFSFMHTRGQRFKASLPKLPRQILIIFKCCQ